MARSEPVRLLLDSCCLLVFITGQADDVDAARLLLEKIEEGEIELWESPLILAEVLPTHPSDGGSGKRALIRGLLESATVEYIDMTSAVGIKAGDYAVAYGLHPADAILLATAVFGKVDGFVTLNTDDFPIGKVVDGVPILTPEGALARFFSEPSQPPLPAS